jgi:hypothetical protein
MDLLIPEMQFKMFVKEFGDGRRKYIYGPEWKAAELLVDGGYDTPEEAKLAWMREVGGANA